ncbi:MAG: sigma-54 interaction domain-containing protein [Gammaproteobacteria bacterium]
MSYSMVVCDDADVRAQLSVLMGSMCEMEVVIASSSDWRSLKPKGQEPEVIIVDSAMDDAHGVIGELAGFDTSAAIIAIGRASLDSLPVAVCCVLPAPIRVAQLYQAIRKARLARRVGVEVMRVKEGFRFTGESPPIQMVRSLIERVGPTDANVLILGDSGTGKELVARHLHAHSERADGPFVPINCGAVPDSLLESELFGHEKGAFTGAITARKGRFELARGGTLFLDEIGDMPLDMQVKLLRVLQERVFEPLGSTRTVQADVRVMAATHRNLEARVESGEFREDLFYRLNVVPIELPTLKERPGDIPLLIQDMLERASAAGRGTFDLSAAALEALERYPWPGNVRELSNLVERLGVLFPYTTVGVAELPAKYQSYALTEEPPGVDPAAFLSLGIGPAKTGASGSAAADGATAAPEAAASAAGVDEAPFPDDGLDLKEYVSDMEARLLERALEANDYVVAQTARKLKINRTTLIEKMRKYGITGPE